LPSGEGHTTVWNLLSISYAQASAMKLNEMMTSIFTNDVGGRTNSIKGSYQVSISVALPNSSPHHVWIGNGKANILSSGKTIGQGNIGNHLGWLWSTIFLLVLREI
jgi:hypothetical protein